MSVVQWNPVSSLTQAVRERFGNTTDKVPLPDVFSMNHPVAYTLIWVVVILLVFIPLSVRAYRRSSHR